MTALKPGGLLPWVKLPTGWINDGGLKAFRWRTGEGSDHAAALMILVVMAHYAEKERGEGDLTYDQLSDLASLSRIKVANGLKILAEKGLIARKLGGRSNYAIGNYGKGQRWGKLPARPLYSNGNVEFFSHLSLRSPAELNALKLYLLFVARRNDDTNLANIGYEKIEDYTAIDRNRIKSALTLLGIHGMAHAEYHPSMMSNLGVSSAYRLGHLDARIHMGTRGRRMDDGSPEAFAQPLS